MGLHIAMSRLLLGQTLATKVEANDRHALGAEPILYLGCMTVHYQHESVTNPQPPAMPWMSCSSDSLSGLLGCGCGWIVDEPRSWRPRRPPFCWILMRNPNDRSGAKVATAAHQFGGEKKRSSHWAIDHFHDRRHQHGFQSHGRALTAAHRNFLNLFELCEMMWMYFEVKQGRYCIGHSELPQISTRPCSIQAPSQKIEWESHIIAGHWKILVSLPIIAHWWS